MAKEIIGTKGGENFYVGSDSAPAQTPAAPPAQGNPPPAKTPGSLTDPNQIISSMVLPMYQNFTQSFQNAQSQLGNQQQLGANSINAANQAAQSAIQAQVTQGQQQLGQQYSQIQQQQSNNIQALSAQQAAASGNTTGNTAFAAQQASINDKFNQALVQVNQAQQLLAVQGTADQQAANAKAAADLLKNAQDSVNNQMSLANYGLSAATQVANIQFQAQQYGLQVDQYLEGKTQYDNALNQTAQQFALDNNITQPLYSIGGITYSTKTRLPANEEEMKAADASHIQVIEPGSQLERQFVMNMANTYFDAGITPQDTIQSARQKLLNSKLYKTATTPSGSGNGYVGTFAQQPLKDTAGNWVGFRLFNSTTGQTQFTDPEGNVIDPKTLPAGYKISQVSAFNSDPIQAAIDSLVSAQNQTNP